MSGPSLPSDPLIPSPKASADCDKEHAVTTTTSTALVEQSLGGRTYKLDPSKIDPSGPFWKEALKSTFMLLATPVLVPTTFLYIVSMYVGPDWYRNKLISLMINTVMKEVGALFDDDRKHLLREIRPGDLILDLGAGPGYYLKYLPTTAAVATTTGGTTASDTAAAAAAGCRVVALEPVTNFHSKYRQLAGEAGLQENQVEIHACEIEQFVREHPRYRASFDWIILGNVLCEVKDQISTLHCVNHLLKPSGHVYFSEHIGSPKGTWKRRVQDCVNPFWRTAGGGCNCNRDSLANIRSMMPGWQVISWQYKNFKVCMGPFVLGLALKNDSEKGP